MARLLLAEAADSDIQAILHHLGEKAGASVAGRYAADFDAVYSRLEIFPELGARRPKLGPTVRICTVLPYVVMYEYTPSDDLVVILRVLHGRRNMSRRSLRGQT